MRRALAPRTPGGEGVAAMLICAAMARAPAAIVACVEAWQREQREVLGHTEPCLRAEANGSLEKRVAGATVL